METSKVGHNCEVSARVIRADGTIEDLGVISETKETLIDRIKSKLGCE